MLKANSPYIMLYNKVWIFTCLNSLFWLHIYSLITLELQKVLWHLLIWPFLRQTISAFFWKPSKKSQPVSKILFLPSVASCPTEIDCSAATATLASCWQARGAEEGFLKFRRLNKQNLTPPQSSDTRSDCCFAF